jgi:hypothetical protein
MKSCLWLLFVALTLPLFADTASSPTPLAPKYDLRVYGTLTTEDKTPAGASYRQIRVTTQNAAKAQLLVSKFLRDFTVLPPVVQQETAVGDKTLPVLAFESGRRILPVWHEGASTVDFYLFTSQMDLTNFVASTPSALSGAVAVEGRKYPYFLDFWDRHCMGSWYAPRLDWDGRYFTEEGNDAFMGHFGLNINLGGDFLAGSAEAARSTSRSPPTTTRRSRRRGAIPTSRFSPAITATRPMPTTRPASARWAR